MNLFVTSIKRTTTTTPEMLFVRVGSGKEIGNGHVSVEFEVELKNIDFMNMTIKDIELLAISIASELIST